MFHNLISQNIYWLGIQQDCRSYAIGCESCLKNNPMKAIHERLRNFTGLRPFDLVQMDLAGPLDRCVNGYAYFLVVIDSLTGYGIIRPMVGKSTDEMAECLLHIFSHYGPPKWIQSDNGSESSNQVVSALLNKISTSFRCPAAYYPSSNGIAERFIGQVKLRLLKRRMMKA
jgi:transposase InsO family protein